MFKITENKPKFNPIGIKFLRIKTDVTGGTHNFNTDTAILGVIQFAFFSPCINKFGDSTIVVFFLLFISYFYLCMYV